MRCSKLAIRLPVLVMLIAVGTAGAEVIDAAANGFTIRHQVSVSADRNSAYRAVVDDIGKWWSSDHTVSGDANNLFIDARTDGNRVAGCFCEILGDGSGLVHLSVSFVNPGVMLRLSGGLGPLGLMGVAGNMTWEFDDADDANAGGSTVTLQYAVGGYMAGGLDAVAGPVDGVLADALERLAAFLETGSPGLTGDIGPN